ncbi:MAG: alpha/beta hydrolase [Candidatus Lokiarchaeota archaeon]|jgi:pimeloyl-ACP methyl ester carboxylesterase
MNIKKLVDNPAISRAIFYPRKVTIPKDLDSNIEPFELNIGSKIVIGGYVFINNKKLPSILYFHGNGEIALDYNYFASQFFECNVNLAVVDFRGYGHSNGKPTYTSLINDAVPIYNRFQIWLRNHSFNINTFVFGRSLGSICAAEIGSNDLDNLKGIVFESGFASTYNLINHFGIDIPSLKPLDISPFSNDTRIRKFQYPTLVIHGTTDFIIPTSEGKLIYKNLPEHIDKTLILIEGATHNNIISFKDEYFEPLCAFIQKYK